MNSSKHLVVLITVPSQEVVDKVAQQLLGNKLAACVNVASQIESHYLWKGVVNTDAEILLIVKTRTELFTRLVSAVKQVHPYEVPEIIALPIYFGSKDYLDWIDEVTEN